MSESRGSSGAAMALSEASAAGPTATPPVLDGSDILTIVLANDIFSLSLALTELQGLFLVFRRARALLNSKLTRFRRWCLDAGLQCRPGHPLPVLILPSDMIAVAQHFDGRGTTERPWLVALADRGHIAASFILARILQADLAAGKSTNNIAKGATQQQIFGLLESAANANHPTAQFYLAECYDRGDGVGQDRTKAAELYQKVADRGVPQAQVALGRCYERGEGVDQSYDTAIEWYSKAADQGSEDGRIHIEFLRGWFSFIGHGVDQSDADAFNRWQEVSTRSSDTAVKHIATHMVGWMHYHGRGTQLDKQKGVKMIRDNKSDEFKLGEGECLAVIWLPNSLSDAPAACRFFELCWLGYDQDWLCRHLTAVCLIYGFGTTKNQMLGAQIFQQLANEGHSDSQYWFGNCYFHGWGVAQDHSKMFQWSSKAADQLNSYGQLGLGHCFVWGNGVPMDRTQAVEWFRKSAAQGNRYGQHNIGICYNNGWGVDRDLTAAISWYNKSSEQGF
ncbi:uncharacterized protein BJ171DRAFT_523042 [Polychytrium aggregatum]|uniref:uncharacterized protein n=1 Tax=Polychytrium aggregatum TaxID=110093 RepID=UPI0022FEFF8D|nr:uncharacterized protein BJ171DRAFT_523042 [Polychytrium aggregatum]KAI9197074.1 hypothetical protein BJ171DRAFT_523042 [Polychytrium aggregatum]